MKEEKEKNKGGFLSKLFKIVLLLSIGAGGVIGYQKYVLHKKNSEIKASFSRKIAVADTKFDDKIDDIEEAFSDFEKRHRKMFSKDEFFKDFDEVHRKISDEIAKNHRAMKKAMKNIGKGDMESSVSFSEAGDSYYYQLNFSGYKAKDIKISVDKGQVVFRTKNKKITGKGKARNVAVNSFYYSFAVPKYKNKSIKREENRIVVRLVKR